MRSFWMGVGRATAVVVAVALLATVVPAQAAGGARGGRPAPPRARPSAALLAATRAPGGLLGLLARPDVVRAARAAGLEGLLSSAARSFVPVFATSGPAAYETARMVARAADPHERDPRVLRRLVLRLRDGAGVTPGGSRLPPLPPAPASAAAALRSLDRQLLVVGATGPWGVTIRVASGQACVLPVGAGVRHVTARRGPCRGDARVVDRYPVRTAAVFVDRIVRSEAAALYLVMWLLWRSFGGASLSPSVGREAWSVRTISGFARRYVGVTTSSLRANAKGLDADGRLQFGRGHFVRCLTLNAPVPWKAGRITWGSCARLPARVVPPPTFPAAPPVPPPLIPAEVAARYVSRFVGYRRDGVPASDAALFASLDALSFGGVTAAEVVGEDPLLAEVDAKGGTLCIAPPAVPVPATAVGPPTPSRSEAPGTWHLGRCATVSLADIAFGASRIFFDGQWDQGLTRAEATSAAAAVLPSVFVSVASATVRRSDPPVIEFVHTSGPVCVHLSIDNPDAVTVVPHPVESPTEAPNTWHAGVCTTA